MAKQSPEILTAGYQIIYSLTQLYETSDATFRTLAQDIQFTHAGYPILEAISNLYLNKQIAFEKL